MFNQENKKHEEIDLKFDFEEAENLLSKQLKASFSKLELLEKNQETRGNPDALGKIV